MTRNEFCQMLSNAKEQATVRLTESLPHILSLTPYKIEAIGAGSYDFNMTDCLHYIQMCGCSLVLEWGQYYCTELCELSDALQEIRKDRDMSLIQLGKASHVSSSITRAFEEGRCTLRVDSFLKIVDALDITLEIE